VFIREDYRTILIESLKFCQTEKGLELYGWCLMPSHVHLIMGSRKNPMEDILRDFKSYTSKKLREAIQNHPGESRKEWMIWMMKSAGKRNSNNNDWQFWQQHNQPIELSTNKMLDQKINYLHNNPVKAGFVSNPEDWIYSSAIDYSGGTGLLDIKIIQ